MMYQATFIIVFIFMFIILLSLSKHYYKKKHIKRKIRFWLFFVCFDIGLSLVAAIVFTGIMYLLLLVREFIWSI